MYARELRLIDNTTNEMIQFSQFDMRHMLMYQSLMRDEMTNYFNFEQVVTVLSRIANTRYNAASQINFSDDEINLTKQLRDALINAKCACQKLNALYE